MLSKPRKKFHWLAIAEMLAVRISFLPRDASCHLWAEVCSSSSSMGLVRLSRIKSYVCFTSNESHPCHPHNILHVRPSPRGNSNPAKCLPAHDTRAQTRLQTSLAPALLSVLSPPRSWVHPITMSTCTFPHSCALRCPRGWCSEVHYLQDFYSLSKNDICPLSYLAALRVQRPSFFLSLSSLNINFSLL